MPSFKNFPSFNDEKINESIKDLEEIFIINNEIKKLEEFMSYMDLQINFSLKLDEDLYLHWYYDNNNYVNRIMIEDKRCNKFHYHRPLIDTSSQFKMDTYKYLHLFVKEFVNKFKDLK